LYLREEHGFGATGGAGAITLAASFARATAVREAKPRFDPVVNLGDRIGSPSWWRGAATLGALIAAVIHVAPPLPSLFRLGGNVSVQPTVGPTPRRRPVVASRPVPTQVIQTGVDRSLGLAGTLERQGVGHEDAAQVARLVTHAAPAVMPGAPLSITLGGTDRSLEALSVRARFDLALDVRRVDGVLTLTRRPIAIDATPVRLAGAIGPSIYGAERQAGAPPSLAADYIRTIARRVDMSEIAPFDRFDMVFEHQRAATGEEKFGRLLYVGLLHGGQVLQLAPWSYEGRDQWFDATGAGETRGGFTMPVTGAQLSSGFGLRFHPLLGFTRMHQGVDLAAPYGTPIVAATDGVVGFAGWKGGYGNFVQIVQGGGAGTGYGHMAAMVVRPGDAVRQGQLIGYVGSTGLSTGPHCHFEVYENGVAIDPAAATFQSTERLEGPALMRFRAVMARWANLPFARS
jgi:murein DD-endopeptidase MepM/ murein hydrolase activator NlpD